MSEELNLTVCLKWAARQQTASKLQALVYSTRLSVFVLLLCSMFRYLFPQSEWGLNATKSNYLLPLLSAAEAVVGATKQTTAHSLYFHTHVSTASNANYDCGRL